MRSCGLLTLNYIKMTSIDLLKEIESWLSFNTEPSKEETAKLRKSIKEHLAEQLRIHDVVRQSEQLLAYTEWLKKQGLLNATVSKLIVKKYIGK